MDERHEQLRKRAKTDLFWLNHTILGKDKLNERVHGPICDLFVKKDDSKPIEEQDTCKERMLLDPRGHFKTTIDIGDAVQWILNFPNIRILFMSGTQQLVSRMMGEVQYAFQKNQIMQELFPEFCVPERAKLQAEQFTSPARSVFLREPTIDISTNESVKASAHYDVIKCDDVVHENNIGTPEQLQKTIDGFGYTDPLLEPYGYRDRIGTRYDYSDLYGWTLDQQDDYIEEQIDFGVRLHAKNLRAIVRKCWICLHDPAIPCKDGDHKLLFPERFSEEWLRDKLLKHPYIFNCQYLNDPRPTEKASFTEELILRHSLPREQLPRQGRVFQMWDLGYSQQKYADYSVCVTGLFDGYGKVFILDLDMGRYSPHELANRVIFNYMLWRPSRFGIEAASGSPLLAPALDIIAARYHLILPLDWVKVRNTKGAKEERIGALHPLMVKDSLYFCSAIPHFADLVKQFQRFPRYARKDIPDAIALLIQNYRECLDVEYRTVNVEMISSPVIAGCEILGTGLIG